MTQKNNFKKIKEIFLRRFQEEKGELNSFKIGVGLALIQIHIMKRKATTGKVFVFYETMTLRSNILRERELVNLQYAVRGGDGRYEKKIVMNHRRKETKG